VDTNVEVCDELTMYILYGYAYRDYGYFLEGHYWHRHEEFLINGMFPTGYKHIDALDAFL
jgi:hypothetical protein